VETSVGDSGNFYKTGCTISLMAAAQPEPWFQALITNNNNNNCKVRVTFRDSMTVKRERLKGATP
jgi:hypothetical protein